MINGGGARGCDRRTNKNRALMVQILLYVYFHSLF
jgi:hypothetical protein